MRYIRPLSVIFFVLGLHIVSMYLNLYSLWANYDVMMHFLGGVAMALLALALFRSSDTSNLKSWLKLSLILGFVAIVGIFWEFQEYGVEYYGWSEFLNWETITVRDTLGDLFNDLLGGLVGYYLFKHK